MSHRSASDKPSVSRDDLARDHASVDEDNEVREEIGKTIAALMPWGISILAHVALIVFAFFLVWQTITTQEAPPDFEPALTQAPPDAQPINVIDEPLENESAGGAAITPIISPVDPTTPVMPGFKMPALTVIGQSDSDWKNDTPGPGKHKKGGPIFDGPPDAFGASNVVFLIDASGSMVDVLPFVINELKQVSNEMAATSKATVIFFSGKGVFEVPGGGAVRGLRPMTPQFKTQIRDWVALDSFKFDTGGRGTAHVGDAIARALSYKPQLVILLSDNLTGGGQGATRHELMQNDLMALIDKHNDHHPPAKFNTVQFLYEDPLVRAGLQGTLSRIAEETRGKFKFVSQSDLKLR